jgi:hypothetical protein
VEISAVVVEGQMAPQLDRGMSRCQVLGVGPALIAAATFGAAGNARTALCDIRNVGATLKGDKIVDGKGLRSDVSGGTYCSA